VSDAGDLEFLALHGLAVRRAGNAATVAEVLGEDPGRVESALEAGVEAGRAVEGRGMFMATPVGRDWLSEQYPERFGAFRSAPGATEAYERFERINRELLRLFTDWQMMPAGNETVPNDHSDPDYDHRIIDRLGELHDRAHRPLEQLADLEPRLGQYPRRLETAYDRILAGEHDLVSGATVDSYHTVWFELHEDLLRMLGREREEQA
jgi:hypothetical protein